MLRFSCAYLNRVFLYTLFSQAWVLPGRKNMQTTPV